MANYKKTKKYSIGASADINPDEIDTTYQNDLSNLDTNKKYLIGNAVGQSLLNLTNLSQAFAKAPANIGIGNIPNVQYPDVTNPMLAEMNSSLGKYRSGVARLAGEKGLSPEVRIGAEADALGNELGQRTKIAELANQNKIAETTANANISRENVGNKYNADWANTQRQDQVAANRSQLFSQGLTNLGTIGTSVTKGLTDINNQKNTLGTVDYYLKAYQTAKTQEERNAALAGYFQVLEQKHYIGIMQPAINIEQITKEITGVKDNINN